MYVVCIYYLYLFLSIRIIEGNLSRIRAMSGLLYASIRIRPLSWTGKTFRTWDIVCGCTWLEYVIHTAWGIIISMGVTRVTINVLHLSKKFLFYIKKKTNKGIYCFIWRVTWPRRYKGGGGRHTPQGWYCVHQIHVI